VIAQKSPDMIAHVDNLLELNQDADARMFNMSMQSRARMEDI